MTRLSPNERLNVIEEEVPDPSSIAAILRGLNASNGGMVSPDSKLPIWLFARDIEGEVVGGAAAEISWNWCYVRWLWVDEKTRGRGLGRELIRRTETIAAKNECLGIYLNTYSFQAPEFYQKLGYQEFGRLEGFPPGHSRIWFSKSLRQ